MTVVYVPNGAVPSNMRVPAAGVSGATLRFGTANRWAKIRNEVYRRFGWHPEIVSAGDGYRTLERQETLFYRNYTTTDTGHGPVKAYKGSLFWRRTANTPSAATPGTSNHGLGTTADVTGLGSLYEYNPTTLRYRQFAEVAAQFGWSNAEGRRIGEPWHWSDTLDPDNPIDGVTYPPTTTTPTPTPPPEDPMPTLDEITEAVSQQLAPLYRRPKRLAYAIPGGLAYFQPLGDDHREWLSAGKWDPEKFEAVPLDPHDGFWSRQSDMFGEVYRKPGKAAGWGIAGHPETGEPARTWLDGPTYAAMGSPLITNLPLEHPFWTLPTYGPIPAEGA